MYTGAAPCTAPEHLMTGAYKCSLVNVCRFQPIGHFLSITMLAEMASAQNQSQNSFEVTTPLAAGEEAITTQCLPNWAHAHASYCAYYIFRMDICRPDRLTMHSLICDR